MKMLDTDWLSGCDHVLRSFSQLCIKFIYKSACEKIQNADEKQPKDDLQF